METANLPSSLGNLLSSICQILLLRLEWILAPCPDMTVAAGAGTLMGSGKRLMVKIIIFPVKFAKFTGLFDKFLKIIFSVNDCNSKVYCINMSDVHSDSGPKKVFGFPRICSQVPIFPLAPHDAANPP